MKDETHAAIFTHASYLFPASSFFYSIELHVTPFLVKGVPPQSNCPSEAVSQFLEISNMKTKGWYYTFAFLTAGAMSSTLPPTLYNRFHIATSDYSKVPWGLRGPDGLIRK